jgi:HlyD family secretion protein
MMRLDDTLLNANLLIYKTRLSEAMATRARLIAEQADMPEIKFNMTDPLLLGVDVEVHVVGQSEIFEARKEFEQGRREQLAEKIRQFQNQTDGVNALIAAKDQQRAFLDTEINAQRQLSEQGLSRASQLLGLQRSQADLLGQIAEHRSELARIQNSVRDTELEVLQGRRQLKEEAVTRLREVSTQIEELRQQITSTQKQLERIAIRAPSNGRVHEMQITTEGGVVSPGGMIMQVIPSDQGFGFRSRIDPASVDQVFVGQEATLRFSAFNQRTTPELNGYVHDISATSVVDEATGQTFYWVTITASETELVRLGDVVLVSGMPVEAYLKTTDRTVLSYLTKPFADQLDQAFREE